MTAARTQTVEMYTITEAAKLVGVTRVTLWRDARDGKLVVHRKGNATLIFAADLLDYVLRHRGGVGIVTA